MIHGDHKLGYVEVTVATAGTWVAYDGPSVPVQAIVTKKFTASEGGVLDIDYANPGTGANAGKLQCFSTVNNKVYRITWIYSGG
jgi:hypothetical protein